MKFCDLEYEDFAEKRLYVAKWIWRQEFKVFVLFDYSLDDAIHCIRSIVSEGGKLTVEEIEFGVKTNHDVALILE